LPPPFLYLISHTSRGRPPHAFPGSSTGEIAAAKMTANKAKLNFKSR